MKILRLGVSHDFRDDIPYEQRQFVLAERILEEATGLDWETLPKAIWPTDEIPALVERWVEREKPDMVVLCLAGYWVSFGSTAVRLERRVPVVGRRLARTSRSVATAEFAKQHATLDHLRGFASALIGVDYNFEPADLLRRFDAVLRQLVRNEELVVAVRGPGRTPQWLTKRQTRVSWARANAWHDGIQKICEQLHVEFLPYEYLPAEQQFSDRIPGDPAHYTVDGTRRHGEREGEMMVRAWKRAEAGFSAGDAVQTSR